MDINVVRLFERVFGASSQKRRPDKDPKYWEIGKKLVPKKKFADFNYALLDLAAQVCKKRPKCRVCPINQICCFYGKVFIPAVEYVCDRKN